MKPSETETLRTGFRTGHFKERLKYRVRRPDGMSDWLLLYTINGTGFFRYPEGCFAAPPGCAVLIPPGLAHDYGLERKGAPWEFLWAHFEPRAEWGSLLNWPSLASGLHVVTCHRPSLAKSVESVLKKMNTAYFSSHPRAILTALNGLERTLLLLDEANPSSVLMRRDDRVQAALDFITGDFRRIRSVEEIATHVGLSESRLSHLFHQQTGMTLVRFLERTRLAHARDYIELTERPIAEIAELVGYRDAFYFSKRFRREFGKSPLAFRRSQHRRRGFGVRT